LSLRLSETRYDEIGDVAKDPALKGFER
jgi:hypothetical protein